MHFRTCHYHLMCLSKGLHVYLVLASTSLLEVVQWVELSSHISCCFRQSWNYSHWWVLKLYKVCRPTPWTFGKISRTLYCWGFHLIFISGVFGRGSKVVLRNWIALYARPRLEVPSQYYRRSLILFLGFLFTQQLCTYGVLAVFFSSLS